jgi:hypothetical protein
MRSRARLRDGDTPFNLQRASRRPPPRDGDAAAHVLRGLTVMRRTGSVPNAAYVTAHQKRWRTSVLAPRGRDERRAVVCDTP